jgi:hypothetical protein
VSAREWRVRRSGRVRESLLAALICASLCASLSACIDATGPGDEGIPLALSVQAAEGVPAAEGAALGQAFDRVDRFRVKVEDAVNHTLYADTVIRVTPGASAHELDIVLPESALGAVLDVTITALQGQVEMFTATVQATATKGDEGDPTQVGVRYTGPGLRGSVAGNDGKGLAGVTVQVLRSGAQVATTTTASDGTFLFMDLVAGTYAVRIPARAGLTACPAERSVTLGSTTAAAVASFQYRSGGCTARVLVVSGGDVNDVGAAASVLAGVADLAVSTFFYVAATPGIEALRAYDVVLLYQNGLFDESVELGDELAQYVALGGNVVFGSFYWQGRSDSGIRAPGWGALEGVDPFAASAGGASYSPSTLGTVTPHALTEGVKSLSSSGYRGGVGGKAGTTVVALWADGVPLVGYREGTSGQRLVAVSLYPAHHAVGGVSGDYARLWQNVVTWAAQAGGPARTGPAPGLP